MRTVLVGLALGCILALEPGCRHTTAPAPEAPILHSFMVDGTVRELPVGGRTVRIAHEAIPDYMAAMTMPFNVKDRRELNGLSQGNRVRFRLQVTEQESWIDQVIRLAAASPSSPPAPAPSTRIAPEVDPLEPGALVPDYAFTNQFGERFTLSSFRGRALAITFIFTRCPLPDFCPRMSTHFAQALRSLRADPKAPTNWHFLTLSFDVQNDTPQVLKAYAARFDYNPALWTFATGGLREIDAISEQLGLTFSRAETPSSFNHNLRTAVIDSGGRLQHVFVGNEWTPAELVSQMTQATRARTSK